MRTQTEHYYQFGPFRLDPEECRLQRDGLLIPLTPKAFATFFRSSIRQSSGLARIASRVFPALAPVIRMSMLRQVLAADVAFALHVVASARQGPHTQGRCRLIPADAATSAR